jgi:adenylate cyclase
MPTDRDKTTRKLKAILSADVKGYSLLMADDEAFTIQTLKEYRTIMSAQIQKHSGRVVDAPGDNLLAEFSSAVEAVQCATDIQKVLKDKNDSLPNGKRLEFRIGVNIGDIVQDGDRIYGSGVNVAARIEGLSDPGGVCISRNAYDHIRDKLDLGYEYLGDHSVKNIKHPVRVYKVLMNPEDVGKLIGEKPGLPKKKWFLPVVIVAAIILTSIVWYSYQNTMKPDIEPASIEKMALPLPDKPSIAVLAFTNMSGEKEQEYFCDGLSEGIINGLAKIDRLFVIARNSTFIYKGKPVAVKQVAEDLGVRYVLEGSIQKVGDRVRITAQLIDALSGHHLFSERYDRELKDILNLQDEITKEVLTAVQIKLTVGEGALVSSKGTKNLDAYLKVLRAREHKGGVMNKERVEKAMQLLEEAIVLDPEYAYAYSILSTAHMDLVALGASDSPKESLLRAVELGNKAVALDESNPYAHANLAFPYMFLKKFDKGISKAEKGVSLAPNYAGGYFALGAVLSMAGRQQEAIPILKKCLRLSPVPVHSQVLGILAGSYVALGQLEDAIATYKKVLHVYGQNQLPAHVGLAITYAFMGLENEARSEGAEVMRIDPEFSVERLLRSRPYDQSTKDRMAAALRKAGLSDKPPLPLPDKPSIAVLPFENLSNDPEQEYFSDGIAVEIINGLVRWPSIVIIPRSSSFIYKGKTVDLKQVGREMGVRYVLEGSVRREENRVRVNTQLVDVTTLKHLFSERYEREMKDIFAIQDDITIGVLTAMRVSLSGTGVPSKRGRPTKSIEAYLKLLQAEDIFISMNRDAQARAKRLAEETISLDPEYARAYALMAATIGNEVLLGVYDNPQEALDRAIELSEKAIQLDASENMAHRVRGFLALQKKDYEKAIAEARRAIELAPNAVQAQMILGYILYSAGRTEEAIPILEKAVALNPIPSPRALSHLGIAYRKARQYEEAVAVCRKLIQIKPDYIYPHITLAATFAEIDKLEEAKVEVKEVLRINPKYTVKLVPRSFPWKDQTELDRLADSLREAGLPE